MCSENAAFVQNSPAPCAAITFSDATRWVLVRQFSRVHLVFMNHLDVGYNGIPITSTPYFSINFVARTGTTASPSRASSTTSSTFTSTSTFLVPFQ
jgi:hypothetical protein